MFSNGKYERTVLLAFNIALHQLKEEDRAMNIEVFTSKIILNLLNPLVKDLVKRIKEAQKKLERPVSNYFEQVIFEYFYKTNSNLPEVELLKEEIFEKMKS